MRTGATLVVGLLVAASAHTLLAQTGALDVPKTVEAGAGFSIQCAGSGKATLYIIGPEQVLKREVLLGQTTLFPAGSLYNAGRYLAVLAGGATDADEFNVVPAHQPAKLSFLARPSRLPVGLHDGITGAVYVFDAYENLITVPTQVSFELSGPSGIAQTRSATTRDGATWTAMDSSAREGTDKFVARTDGVAGTRMIEQVPGDPCSLKMNARQSGQQLELETDPVRDCSGNAVPDGTIVTFTEAYNGNESTVDVPLKRGIAKLEMPAHPGATITVASGVALGNQIRWGR